MRREQEHESIDPRLLTPEYWDSHSFTDNCADKAAENPKVRSGISLLWEKAASNVAVQKLTDKVLLGLRDKLPDRPYAPGVTFSVENLHEGTIIGFKKESLSKKGNSAPVYENDYRWGIVFGYQDKGKRKKALVTAKLTTAINGVPRLASYSIEEQPITGGDVVHRIRNQGKKNQISELIRFSEISIYEEGKPKERKRRVRLPIPRTVFVPKPAFHHT